MEGLVQFEGIIKSIWHHPLSLPVAFLYPIFLAAGITLTIPLLIHLFNLRRYKTVYFPHTRFLKAIQLRSRRSSEVHYKWLLALRMLFLTALIAAFAQPFFNKSKSINTAHKLQVIYIDNNPAMGLKIGVRLSLDVAIEAARKQVYAAPLGTKFLLLTNESPTSFEPLPADKILSSLNKIEISPNGKSSAQIFAIVQSLMQTENTAGADLYYFSDFSRTAFSAHPEAPSIKGITLHAMAVQAVERVNSFIDTAFLTTPVLQTGQPNSLVVRTNRIIGKNSKSALGKEVLPILQLAINGQVKSAASIRFDENGKSLDTLSFSLNEVGWQRLVLSITDNGIRMDDTFRIAARSAPGLSVLVLNAGNPSPYIQAAFRSYSGFTVRSEFISNAPADWKDYNLIVFNGISGLSENVGKQMQMALTLGQSVCIFPSKTRNLADLNEAMKFAGDIRFIAYDSTSQATTNLQPNADLVRDIFEGIPPNVQLPIANWHYSVQAGLTASGQSILTFRNGDPLLAKYASSKGNLYVCATSADIDGGNFPASYFFVPFLYQMAANSKGGAIYALSSGKQQSAFLPIRNSNERNMVHVYAPGLDAIPPQRTAGGGVDVFVDAVVQQPNFYKLAAPSGDSAVVALNGTRVYSNLDFWDLDVLQKEWPDNMASWQTPETMGALGGSNRSNQLPLWKVCAILALLLTLAETYLLLARRDSTTSTATN